MKLLIIDNYDSFTYNIVHATRELGISPTVSRNDRFSIEDAGKYDKIIISPGPGIPEEAGIMPEVLRQYADKKPIMGICLGHQAIGERFGAHLKNLNQVYHGIKTPVNIITDDYLFHGVPKRFDAGRYHSWVIDPMDFPESLEVIAVSDDNEIMAIRHKKYDVRGVQFHPESILTPYGLKIIENWLKH